MLEGAVQGTLARDVELRTSQNGKPWCKFAVAVSQEGKDGESTTCWLQIVCFNDVAERVAKQASKGSKLYCEGQLRTTEWQDKATGEKRHGLELKAWRVTVMGAAALGQNKVASKKTKSTPREERPANGHVNEAARDWQRPPAGDEIPF
jgi:single stranded DNA-binding protein